MSAYQFNRFVRCEHTRSRIYYREVYRANELLEQHITLEATDVVAEMALVPEHNTRRPGNT